jgi:DNA-binding NarL/FixJ family response regulator
MFADALSEIIEKDTECQVLYTVRNGKQMLDRFAKQENIPDLVLFDLTMPKMNVQETALWLQEHHRDVKVLVVTMNGSDEDIIQILRTGTRPLSS